MADSSLFLLPQLAAASSSFEDWEQAFNQVNWSNVSLNTLLQGANRTPSQISVSVPLTDGTTARVLFEGTGFQYDFLGIPSAGTLSKGTISKGSTILVQSAFQPTTLQSIATVLSQDLSDDNRLGENTLNFLRSRLEFGSIISLAVSPAAVTEDGLANLIYTFTRTGPTTSPLTVNFTVAGTAFAPDPLALRLSPPDYTGIVIARPSNMVRFTSGAATATVVVNPTADITAERNETVSLSLAAGTGYSIGTPSAVTGTILNDDVIGTVANDTRKGTSLPEFIDGRQGRDTLTGGGARDVFGFSFGHSTIPAPDRITDFQIGVDKIDLLTAAGSALPAPTAFSRASNNSTARTLSDLAAAMFRDANGAVAGNQALGANRAAVVVATRTPIAGTYLFINDGNAARNNSNDLLINIRGFSGGLPGLGGISVNSFFL